VVKKKKIKTIKNFKGSPVMPQFGVAQPGSGFRSEKAKSSQASATLKPQAGPRIQHKG